MTTVTHPAPSVPTLCNDCGALGCDDCYGTGTSEEREERMTDIDAIRERHVEWDGICAMFCIGDDAEVQDWPCDTRIVLDALDAARADADLVLLTDAMHYRIRGMDKERERRQANASASAKARWNRSDRNATAMRPHSDRNATAMLAKPSRDEPSQAIDATAYDTYYECTGWTVSEKALPFLREIVEGWGHERTAATMRRLWDADPDKKTIFSRVKTALLNEDDAARSKAEERRKRGAIEETRALENAMPEEQRKANLVRLRDEMAARGLV